MPRHLTSAALLSILALSATATLTTPTPATAQSGLQSLLNLGGQEEQQTPEQEAAIEEAQEQAQAMQGNIVQDTMVQDDTAQVDVLRGQARQGDETGLFGMISGNARNATAQTGNQAPANDASMAETQMQLEERIDERLQSIIDRIASPSRAPIAEDLTVEDLDRLRREAERASSTRALREAEFEEIQAELEMISFLQTTLAEIRDTRAAMASRTAEAAEPEEQIDVEELRAQWEAERAAQEAAERNASTSSGQPSINLTPEQSLIPRLVSIRGAGGQYEAEIESARGVTQYVEPGDALADGFTLESVDGKGVVIRAQSGNRYSLIPSPPVGGDGPATTTNTIPVAQDVGPGAGMF